VEVLPSTVAVATTGNLKQRGGIIDISGGTLSVAAVAMLKQTGGSILIGDGTLETGNLTQTGGAIGFDASGGRLQFGIGGTPIDVRMAAEGVADTVAVTSNKNVGILALANFFAGKSPRELMTGEGHPHWLTLLGLGPLQNQRA
jgi:hypothetical protein